MATNDSGVARRKANTAAIGKASKKIQAIADVRKTASEVDANPKITKKVITQMRKGLRPETNHQPRIGGSGGIGAAGMDLGGGGRPEQIK